MKKQDQSPDRPIQIWARWGIRPWLAAVLTLFILGILGLSKTVHYGRVLLLTIDFAFAGTGIAMALQSLRLAKKRRFVESVATGLVAAGLIALAIWIAWGSKIATEPPAAPYVANRAAGAP